MNGCDGLARGECGSPPQVDVHLRMRPPMTRPGSRNGSMRAAAAFCAIGVLDCFVIPTPSVDTQSSARVVTIRDNPLLLNKSGPLERGPEVRGRYRIRTCVGVSRRIYSPLLSGFVKSSCDGSQKRRRSDRCVWSSFAQPLQPTAGDPAGGPIVDTFKPTRLLSLCGVWTWRRAVAWWFGRR
jgi:hypothetical protein